MIYYKKKDSLVKIYERTVVSEAILAQKRSKMDPQKTVYLFVFANHPAAHIREMTCNMRNVTGDT